MSAEQQVSVPQPIQILLSIIGECEDTLRGLYNNLASDDGIPAVVQPDLYRQVCRLGYELTAAYAVANVAQDTGKGWPDEAGGLAALSGERSGYPLDLVTGLLSQAQAMAGMIRVSLKAPGAGNAVADGTAHSALWGVHGLLKEVVAIITYRPVGEPAER